MKPNFRPFLALFPHHPPLYRVLLLLFSVALLPGKGRRELGLV